MNFHTKDRIAYQKITEAFKKQRTGATPADVVATTGLPLHKVRELIPLAADEYSARLEVTESGEILYSFPGGFTSKYRGFRARLRSFGEKFGKAAKTAGRFLFKIWIMLMLVGYFVLFMLIALASLLLSVASNSNNRSDERGEGFGGLWAASAVFDLIIRLWFYSELTKTLDRNYRGQPQGPKPRPLYKAIFSFIFGDEDPNKDWSSKEKQNLVAYLQANRGVMTLPEFMSLTGRPPQEAESAITAFCVEFGGMPEAAEDGTVVYRFDELLLRKDTRDRSFNGAVPLKRLKAFSSNPKSMNLWFSILNGVNLVFGSYFLYNAVTTGAITPETAKTASYIYHVGYVLFGILAENPLPFITIGLGAVPVIFSLLFWIIPAVRRGHVKKENENITMENLRKAGYSRIWSDPGNVVSDELIPQSMNPPSAKILPKAKEKIIQEMGSYALPEVTINDAGKTVYAFKDLEREKSSLQKYRNNIKTQSLGQTVFDSGV
ncbi:MAG: hypothetical protein LBG90_00565 [Spirochaetaceae bacterium]|jgi:hypothetical protein|nr:hypothetical protein [Spirochaetaceae bacterium]